MSKAIDVAGLRKSYGKVTALDGLDLNVASGEVHGFLGPNGAGKTTTIRILLGLLRSDGGSARLLGGDPWTEATTLHRRLAYVPGDVTVKARAYSKGNRQKVALIAALASDVELLMLDEPTAGLDPLMEAAFRACITEERGRGRTVLLSSHILSEVEALCDRVTIIRRGRAVESGTLADLRHLTRTSISAELAAPPEGLDRLPGIHGLVVEGLRVRCEVDTDKLDGLLRILTAAGVRSLVSQPPTLEELFLRHYTGEEPARGVAQDTAGARA